MPLDVFHAPQGATAHACLTDDRWAGLRYCNWEGCYAQASDLSVKVGWTVMHLCQIHAEQLRASLQDALIDHTANQRRVRVRFNEEEDRVDLILCEYETELDMEACHSGAEVIEHTRWWVWSE